MGVPYNMARCFSLPYLGTATMENRRLFEEQLVHNNLNHMFFLFLFKKLCHMGVYVCMHRLVSLLLFGEGWHNNHHAFEYSAQQGLEWWQLDITWYMVKLLQAIGLATDVKLATEIQKRKFASKVASWFTDKGAKYNIKLCIIGIYLQRDKTNLLNIWQFQCISFKPNE